MKIKVLHKTLLLFSLAFIFSSCGINKLLSGAANGTYPGTVYLSNGEKKNGYITMPGSSSKVVQFQEQNNGVNFSIDASDIEKLEFGSGFNTQTMRYLPVKGMFGKIKKYWLLQIGEGEYLSVYIGAENYNIGVDGNVSLIGTRQVINNGSGTAIINPSFPIYMQRNGDKAFINVGVKGGVSFEGSTLRSGISRYLYDDPTLCEYMRQEKWSFDNIPTLAINYDPYRGNKELVIDGKVIEPKKKSVLTNDLDGEMIFYIEAALPSDDLYGTQFALGLRSSKYKFFSYGGDLGFASAKYVDDVKWIENHPIITGKPATPVTNADFSKSTLFRFDAFVGGQLPFRLGNVYLVPAAHIVLGGTLGSGYDAFYYGPMGTLDLGFKLKHGDIFFIGAGYRRNILLKGQGAKDEASFDGFKAYEPYGNLLLRVGYKF